MELKLTAQRSAKLFYLLRQELGMSSGLVKRLKFQNAYFVNNVPVHTDHLVVPGDVIRVLLDEADPVYPAEDLPITVLYEDDFLIAVDKPAGMLVHPSSARNTGTLANRLIAYYAKTGQHCAVHPVSRLDRDTFGVVVLAKNSHSHAKMCELSHSSALRKVYHAAVCGRFPSESGKIEAPIARVSELGMLREVREDGKPACSLYRVLTIREPDDLVRSPLSRVELQPMTGRTHQLRIHCAYVGCPILGDPQYTTPFNAELSAQLHLSSQQLCAVSVSFVHPFTGKPMEIRSNQDVSLDF